MIQSDKFDSSKMDIKKIVNSLLVFAVKRLLEITGIILSLLGILLFLSLITYSPEDPNFIFPQKTEIKNLLGFYGSYISDLFFQSIGLSAYLVPITYIFTGINIFKKNQFFLFFENNFYIVTYSLTGSVFFSYYYKNAFSLYINGNGGFVGNYFNQNYLKNQISNYENFFYYSLIILITLLFLKGINFNPKKFFCL